MKFSTCLIFSVFALFQTACKEDGDLLFHDTFDYYEVGTAPLGPWSTEGGGVIIVDTIKSYSGKQSIYFESGEGYDQRAFLGLTGTPLFPFMYNRITGSFQLWLDEASPDGIHWTMVQASGPVRDRDYTSEIRYGGQHKQQLMANYDTQGKKSDCWQHAPIRLPEKQWVKIGWQFDGMNQRMKFWLNDTLIEELTVEKQGQGCVSHDLDDQWIFPVFEQLMIGWVDYQLGGGSRRFWIDDVKFYQ
ncbi:hypothetical protein N7E81_13410 [Reichenbachiella carrageenanivorans]|uniref:Cip1-like core domain-containing protein n=1 Tax=Reichenbachiella carrageenanivorans TaxID=2979869 RepID=A0ABY6CWR9_9BACT|nr:hypothetical protein [Reichenbachiella carrageenanivorans]UXX78355.1 hypothetical protein N7E81_13410 [Reichenbachiella carrageenanivorans]